MSENEHCDLSEKLCCAFFPRPPYYEPNECEMNNVTLNTVRAFGKVVFYKHSISAAQKCCCPRSSGNNEGCGDREFVKCHVANAKCSILSLFHNIYHKY